ncbi:MAG: ATP-dependent zinc metalloprotease FtsH, partial [Victivallaceae bacterium]
MATEQIPPQRSGRAALVWLLIFMLLGSLFLFRGAGTSRVTDFDQTAFETKLAAGDIKTAVITSESDRILGIEGKFFVPESEAAKPSAAGEAAAKEGVRTEGSYRTRVIFTEKLGNLLNQAQVKVESSKEPWWSLLISLLPVILILGAIYFFTSRQIRAAGRGAMDFGKSRARMIPPDELHVKFDDIAGADEAKEEIQEIVEFLRDPLRFQLVGGRIPKGCLLVGSPGTGKTLLAKAVACEAGVPFFSISGSDFVEMFVGVGASRVRDMFEQARKNTPSLLFIDEIDAVGRSRFSGMGGGHDEREQTLNAMLVEMDGLASRSGVIVLAATNRPDVLDPALLRPGRFDRQIVMDLPDIVGRRKILDVHVKAIKVDGTVDLDVIARTTPGFSGADLANLCNEAALLAARYNRDAVTGKDMEEARDKVCYGRERRSRKIIDRERRLTAYHEAGHALVAIHSPHATPVHKVTIIPRGQAYLGATCMMPKEDVYTHSRLEILDEMAVSMGGRVAEELV